jgi:hypothetical protein
MYEIGVSFDWITPLLQIVNMARGHKGLIVTVEEMERLRRVGISCRAPMRDVMTGEYLIQLSRSDYKLACRVLGLGRG